MGSIYSYLSFYFGTQISELTNKYSEHIVADAFHSKKSTSMLLACSWTASISFKSPFNSVTTIIYYNIYIYIYIYIYIHISFLQNNI